MTAILNWSIVTFILVICCLALEVSRASKSWISFGLTICLLTRILVSIVLDGGLKYLFVIDSLAYEYKGWLLAQPWMSVDLFTSLTPSKSGQFNYYEIMLSWIFKLFGKDALIATICNCILSTMTIGLLVFIYRSFFAAKDEDARIKANQSSLILVFMLSIYPSYMVWSATNTRDPLYFFACVLFFACFLTAFSRRSLAALHLRLIAIMGSLFSIWIVLGVRAYVNGLFAASIASGLVLFFLSRKVKWPVLSFCLSAFIVSTLFIYQATFPETTHKILESLGETRVSFANVNSLDNVAKSSFGLEYTFRSVWDLLIFLPNALAHYFFGPFLWEISSGVQAFSLLETVCIYLITKPTIRGIRAIYRRAPFETITVLSFTAIFSISQSLVISNMGTVFRHRTLSFLFLLIFTCEGLHGFAKKNLPSLFEA